MKENLKFLFSLVVIIALIIGCDKISNLGGTVQISFSSVKATVQAMMSVKEKVLNIRKVFLQL